MQVLMIIKGIFRRYQRWNPVHPTSGAFWGMGIGLGCGVGWGPGFGPEAIGFVGAGCGIGFSVGITLVGFGVGLPATSLMGAPYNALVAMQNGLVELARLSGCSQRKLTENGPNGLAASFSALQREVCGVLTNIYNQESFDENRDSASSRSIVSMPNGSFPKHIGKSK
uniref:Cadmium-induced protein AS8 n=1 Tax=Kalanchoe fedtschenkoi TaxID=63787 RepID=A0A7N1A5G8_KALFE